MPTPGVTENVNKTLILRAGNCLWGKHLDKLLGETHESGYDKTQEGFVWGWDFLKGRIRSEVEGEEEGRSSDDVFMRDFVKWGAQVRQFFFFFPPSKAFYSRQAKN